MLQNFQIQNTINDPLFLNFWKLGLISMNFGPKNDHFLVFIWFWKLIGGIYRKIWVP